MSNEPKAFHIEAGGVVFEKPKSDKEVARETRDREQHEFARDQVKTNRKLAWFTGLLVVGTFIGTGIGIWQARIAQIAASASLKAAQAAEAAVMEAYKSRLQSSEESKSSREFSERQSKDATQSNERQSRVVLASSLDAFRNEQRAWVHPLGFEFEAEPSIDNKWIKVIVSIINSGKTPGNYVGMKSQISLYDHEPPAMDWSLVQLEPYSVLFPGIAGTKFSQKAEMHGTVEIEKYTSKVARIYFRSCILYRDIFNHTHFTENCVSHAFGDPVSTWLGCKGDAVDSPTSNAANNENCKT